MNTKPNPYLALWEELEATKPPPAFFTSVSEMDYTEFAEKVFEADPKFVRDTVESMYGGTALILKKSIERKDCEHIIEKTWDLWKDSPSEFYKIEENCPNFHRVIDSEISKKYTTKAIKHSYYLFRWNEDPAKIWDMVSGIWQTFKYAGGFPRDAYEINTPRDRVVDRLQLIQYPLGGGNLKLHYDPRNNQRFIIGILLTRRGEDYESGGFFALNENGEKCDFENRLDAGDILICYPTIVHGVNPVDPDRPLDWDSPKGRWYLGIYSNDSDMVKNRESAITV
ncbi:MAG: hypothetical protein HQ513_11450 [Rhodospirillales bacterium]|nr:hypothetical protein [Rhodospirillales bacterium]